MQLILLHLQKYTATHFIKAIKIKEKWFSCENWFLLVLLTFGWKDYLRKHNWKTEIYACLEKDRKTTLTNLRKKKITGKSPIRIKPLEQ